MKNITLKTPIEDEYFYQEAIKTLRTNVQFSGKNHKALMLTSTYSNEGKSDVCLNLAIEMGKAGKKVLLIDADIRKSVFVSRYQIAEQANGLSQFLSGQIEKVDQLIYKTNYENLYMILAGPYAPNPTEMLGDQTFGDLIKAARQVYDYVFIDTPPLGSIIDAAVIAQFCDGAMMVIESGNVSYRMAQKIKSQLERSGCKLLGVVLNKVDMKKERYYGAKYGKYGKYGKYEKYGE